MERPVLGLVDPPQDGSPGLDEVLQREALPEWPIPAAPVHVDGPVQTQELPPRTSTARTIVVDAVGVGEELLAKDPRRGRAIVMALDEGMVIGLTSQDCVLSAGVAPGLMWPKLVPLEIRGWSRLFVGAQANTTKVVVLAESWAD